jgi:hypothetical protein
VCCGMCGHILAVDAHAVGFFNVLQSVLSRFQGSPQLLPHHLHSFTGFLPLSVRLICKHARPSLRQQKSRAANKLFFTLSTCIAENSQKLGEQHIPRNSFCAKDVFLKGTHP